MQKAPEKANDHNHIRKRGYNFIIKNTELLQIALTLTPSWKMVQCNIDTNQNRINIQWKQCADRCYPTNLEARKQRKFIYTTSVMLERDTIAVFEQAREKSHTE